MALHQLVKATELANSIHQAAMLELFSVIYYSWTVPSADYINSQTRSMRTTILKTVMFGVNSGMQTQSLDLGLHQRQGLHSMLVCFV